MPFFSFMGKGQRPRPLWWHANCSLHSWWTGCRHNAWLSFLNFLVDWERQFAWLRALGRYYYWYSGTVYNVTDITTMQWIGLIN